MLTLAEMESTLQIEYELQLETFSEEALRELLADAAALNALIPEHLSDVEGRRIAEATLAKLVARKTSDGAPAALSAPAPAWDQIFALFWMPFRQR